MSILFRTINTALLLIVLTNSHATDQEFQVIGWEELMPKNWSPEPNNSTSMFLEDSGDESLQSPSAPTVGKLNNQRIKIPGFMLPLEFNGDEVSEFLLVPYVGACLHVPPPPANQVIYVKLKKPWVSIDLYEPVWVEGIMQVESVRSEYAEAAYTIDGQNISKYEWE